MSRTRKFLSLAVFWALLGLTLVSCGESRQPGQATAQLESAEATTISERCSLGIVVEYDGSSAGATRLAALENLGTMLTVPLPQTLTTQDPPLLDDQLKDPIRVAAGLRGLEALKELLPSAEEGRKPGDPIEVTATTGDGQQLATASISVQFNGGYVVDVFNAAGFQSDGEQCK